MFNWAPLSASKVTIPLCPCWLANSSALRPSYRREFGAQLRYYINQWTLHAHCTCPVLSYSTKGKGRDNHGNLVLRAQNHSRYWETSARFSTNGRIWYQVLNLWPMWMVGSSAIYWLYVHDRWWYVVTFGCTRNEGLISGLCVILMKWISTYVGGKLLQFLIVCRRPRNPCQCLPQ